MIGSSGGSGPLSHTGAASVATARTRMVVRGEVECERPTHRLPCDHHL